MKFCFWFLVVVAVTAVRAPELQAESGGTKTAKVSAAKPNDLSGYNELALSLIRRARETTDDRYYDQAAEAVRKSLALVPDDFETRKLHVMVLLGKHEYPEALSEAQALNKKIPDDVTVRGLLTDAYSALGDYKNAEIAAQWMLNLRPGNLPAFVNAAHLREIFGDPNGAYDALNLAYQGTSPTASADRASLLTQMGRERRLAAKDDEAEKLLKQALDLFPAYNRALGELADVYLDEKRYDDAIALLRQREKAVPTARNAYSLAEALERSGRSEEAKGVYAEFLQRASLEAAQKNNANLELVLYYADRAHQPLKALELAGQEYAWRHDIYTLDAYAWALHLNGRDDEARKQMDIALAVGTRDPNILAHAAKIKSEQAATLR
jgi:tetratricopeptide (TPR) repeat protein